jgi:dihydrolipoamide dehydrogenase
MADPTAQLAVIGAGPGGYAAAFLAADLGMQVTLVDSDPSPGGVCLHRGCIPSKALLHAAALLTEAREASRLGITFSEPMIDVARLRDWKDGVVGKMTRGLAQLAKARRVTYLQGRARLLDGRTLEVTPAEGEAQRLSFEHAILATGSHPALPPALAHDSPRLMDSTAALALEEVPESLLVVGGGYIGLELGTVYAALGTRVTCVEMTGELLPGADRDLVKILSRRLRKAFAAIHLETTVTGLEEDDQGLRVHFDGKGPAEDVFQRVLVATGRRPRSGDLGLENTSVVVNEHGFVEVDESRRTAEPTIFAIGDLTGEPMLAHKATHEGLVAVEAIRGRNVVFEPRAIPAVVFTDPEIAWCGLSETAAEAENRAVKVTRFPWGASGRATTRARDDGLTKLLCDPESGRILGVGIVGAGAGELIGAGVLAMEMGASAGDVALTIHPHPTLSETFMEAAELFTGRCTDLPPAR